MNQLEPGMKIRISQKSKGLPGRIGTIIRLGRKEWGAPVSYVEVKLDESEPGGFVKTNVKLSMIEVIG